jgi:thermitase
MMKVLTLVSVLALAGTIQAETLLVKLASPASTQHAVESMKAKGLQAEVISGDWIEISGNVNKEQFQGFVNTGLLLHTQPNYRVNTYENPALPSLRKNKNLVAYVEKISALSERAGKASGADNPKLPTGTPAIKAGNDPLIGKQWGMKDLGVEQAWAINFGTNQIVVAVIDTGIDYNHEDLRQNLWINKKEIPDNGKDDDKNGYVDDIIGWDYVGKDNKPYDLTGNLLAVLGGGNPGHGTHCAGNIAATGKNSVGITGVAPRAKIMALRFIGDKGGTTADAVKAIRYAVDNGAKVLSNSWGSSGEDPADAVNNKALTDAIQYAQEKGVLFIAAAGNGDQQGVGYSNDGSKVAAYPASYPNDNIISVAAIDSANALGKFSNWGAKTVDIGAPGVKVFSTTSDGKYSDSMGIAPIPGLFPDGFTLATWDGTSMATPHVAGAAALYWSANPTKTWKEVKTALLSSVTKTSSLTGKVSSNGKLNVLQLMKTK